MWEITAFLIPTYQVWPLSLHSKYSSFRISLALGQTCFIVEFEEKRFVEADPNFSFVKFLSEAADVTAAVAAADSVVVVDFGMEAEPERRADFVVEAEPM